MNIDPDRLNAKCTTARERLLSEPEDPFVFADWKRVLFLHHGFDTDLVRRVVPPPFEIEEHDRQAVVTLVALTMRNFRPPPGGTMAARLLRMFSEQRFLNVRTYACYGGEPGAFFLWGWLSRPFGLPLPRPPGLPCGFARMQYDHRHESRRLAGRVQAGRGRLVYSARLPADAAFRVCEGGSLGGFALERYTGFFLRAGGARVFRAWHPAWLQLPVEADIEEDSMVRRKFPWFVRGRFLGAHYARGFDEQVWIGRPCRIDSGR